MKDLPPPLQKYAAFFSPYFIFFSYPMSSSIEGLKEPGVRWYLPGQGNP